MALLRSLRCGASVGRGPTSLVEVRRPRSGRSLETCAPTADIEMVIGDRSRMPIAAASRALRAPPAPQPASATGTHSLPQADVQYLEAASCVAIPRSLRCGADVVGGASPFGTRFGGPFLKIQRASGRLASPCSLAYFEAAAAPRPPHLSKRARQSPTGNPGDTDPLLAGYSFLVQAAWAHQRPG